MTARGQGKVFPDPTASSCCMVLRTWPTGETTTIASLLTREHGYVRVIAKGARGEKSRLRQLVQPGSLCNLEYSWRDDRDLQYLRGGEQLASPLQDAPTLERSAYLLAMVEILDRCRLDESHLRDLFEFCRNHLSVLSCRTGGCEVSRFYAFELALLEAHGLAPQLVTCLACGTDVTRGGFTTVSFDIPHGGVNCPRCLSLDGDHVVGRISAVTRQYLHELQTAAGDAGRIEVPDRVVRREAGIILHHFLVYHLAGYRLPAALDMLKTPATSRSNVVKSSTEEES